MANASPSARVRFNANTDTSVANVIARITAIEPRIANMPTANGSAAASRPPKTQTSSPKLSGTAMASITSKSLLVWSMVCA